MKEDSCLSLAFHYPHKPKQGSSVELQEFSQRDIFMKYKYGDIVLQVGIDR